MIVGVFVSSRVAAALLGPIWIVLIMLAETTLPGAEVPKAEPADPTRRSHSSTTNSAFKQTGPGTFALGEVHLDQRTRAVTFPATLNLRAGPIEYLVVAVNGKTHESLLRTDVSPFHLQLALLLLGAKGTTNALPLEPDLPLPGDLVTIELNWKDNGAAKRFPAEQFVHDQKRNKVMTGGTWTYNGSRFREDGFAAQLDGSIVSLITDADALINNPRPGREDDDNWTIQTNGLPQLNAPVEVIITLRP